MELPGEFGIQPPPKLLHLGASTSRPAAPAVSRLTAKFSAISLRDRIRRVSSWCRPLAAALVAGGLMLSSAAAGEIVAFDSQRAAAGTIIVHTKQRLLYLVVSPGIALRYSVGVGRSGRQWQGRSTISGKYLRPNWEPPAEIRRDKPQLPEIIPSGSPHNPMGAAAMTIAGGLYAIHGTNRPASIGGFVSYGCIRMYNADILDLFERVNVGTPVIVTP